MVLAYIFSCSFFPIIATLHKLRLENKKKYNEGPSNECFNLYMYNVQSYAYNFFKLKRYP